MTFKESELCRKCHAPNVWDMLTDDVHDQNLCEGRQLAQNKAEIKKLKAGVDFWKDGWYEGRAIIGELWWFHPAIDSDAKQAYYAAAQTSMRGDLVVAAHQAASRK
jgi:hypothetical protein